MKTMTTYHLDCTVQRFLEEFVENELGPPELVNLARLKLDAMYQLYEGELLTMPMDDGRASLKWQRERRRLLPESWVHDGTAWSMVERAAPQAPVVKHKPVKAKGYKKI